MSSNDVPPLVSAASPANPKQPPLISSPTGSADMRNDASTSSATGSAGAMNTNSAAGSASAAIKSVTTGSQSVDTDSKPDSKVGGGDTKSKPDSKVGGGGTMKDRRCCSKHGIYFVVDIEWKRDFWASWAWLKSWFSTYPTDGSDPPEQRPASGVLIRWFGFLVTLALVGLWFTMSYSFYASSCLWLAHTEALSKLQVDRIGLLLNGTAPSTTRVAKLTAAKIGISELRSLVKDDKAEGSAEGPLESLLQQYSDEVSATVSKLLKVDASVASLVHVIVTHNIAAYELLEASSHTVWWSSWHRLYQGPSFEASYLSMLHLEDAIIRGLESSLYEATTLLDTARSIQNTTVRLHQHPTVRKLALALRAGQSVIDALPMLWDAVAPYRVTHFVKADRRRLLAGARPMLKLVSDYAAAVQKDVMNLTEQMHLLKGQLVGRKSQSTSWWWIWSSVTEEDLCPPRADQGARAFEPLVYAAKELSAQLARRL